MDAVRWMRVRALFEQAVSVDGERRDAWLHGQCAGDDALRGEVQALLDADAAEVDTAAIARAPELFADYADRAAQDESQQHTGRRFGPYRVVGELGRGGMGAVYLAERDDGQYRSQAAIKLIRASWDEAELGLRFAAERRILASLNHPNIARLLDAGISDSQQPYLVLEYVRGHHIGAYCDRARLGVAPRLQLFLSVCAAVSHAHERLVVHRDLKPSNILVADDGSVKLLDFGVAKLLGADGFDGAQTATAARAFTPEYAAPEQILGEPITTAVDVYALGLLLYELLSGERPYKPATDSRAAIERAVLEQQALRPSAALSRQDAEQARRIAEARDSHPQRLRLQLRGDLDAIVLKALRKEPEHRYAAVRELADDVRRHLEQRPVQARQGGTRYRMARFAVRHRLALALGATAVLALFAGLAIALWQAHEARLQRDLARAETEKTRQALAFVSGVFAVADPGEARGAQVTARELLERGATRIHDELKGQPDARAELLGVLGRSYLGLGLYPRAVELSEEAVRLRRQLGADSALGAALLDLGRALIRAGRAADAVAPLSEAETLLAASGDSGDLRTGAAAVALGNALQILGRLEDSDAVFERAVQRLGSAGSDSSAVYVEALAQRTSVKVLRNDLDAADRLSSAAVAVAERLPAEDDATRILALKSRGVALQNLDRDAEAEPIRRSILAHTERIYGAEHPNTASALNDLASAIYNQKRYADAAPLFERVVALRRKQSGPDHPSLATALNNLASLKISQHQPEAAEPLFREALEIRRKRFGNEHYQVATSLAGLGLAESQQGRQTDAARDLEEALRVMRAAAPENRDYAAGPLSELALVYLELPGRDPGCAVAREAVLSREAEDPARSDRVGRLSMARSVLGVCLIEHGDGAEGRALIESSLAKARAGYGADNSRILLLERHLARH